MNFLEALEDGAMDWPLLGLGLAVSIYAAWALWGISGATLAAGFFTVWMSIDSIRSPKTHHSECKAASAESTVEPPPHQYDEAKELAEMRKPGANWADRLVLGEGRKAAAVVLALSDGESVRLERDQLIRVAGPMWNREVVPIALLVGVLKHPTSWIEWEEDGQRNHVLGRAVTKVTLIAEDV